MGRTEVSTKDSWQGRPPGQPLHRNGSDLHNNESVVEEMPSHLKCCCVCVANIPFSVVKNDRVKVHKKHKQASSESHLLGQLPLSHCIENDSDPGSDLWLTLSSTFHRCIDIGYNGVARCIPRIIVACMG